MKIRKNNINPSVEGETLYGKCSSACDAINGSCSSLNQCPLSKDDGGEEVCSTCKNITSGVHRNMYNDIDINCMSLKQKSMNY